MREALNLRAYQERIACEIAVKERLAVIAQPGMGKTIIALRALQLIRPKRTLVVAPLQIALNVWAQEIERWDLFETLQCQVLHKRGFENPKASIDIVNPEGLERLNCKYEYLIIDESSLYKSVKSKRFKQLRDLAKKIRHRIGLSGNPVPNNFLDLFGQMALVDGGESFGLKITDFRKRFFVNSPIRISSGVMVDKWDVDMKKKPKLFSAMAYRTHVINAKGNIELPNLVVKNHWVSLDKEAQKTYDLMEREFFIALQEKELLVGSAGASYWKCHQLANGRCYVSNTDRNIVTLHNEKVNALKHLVEELNGKPLLVAYLYEHDVTAIKNTIKGVEVFSGSNIERWNAKRVPVYCVPLKSASRGLNLQYGSNHLAFFSVTDNYDDYYQMICRLYRHGAKEPVFVHRIVAKRTVDEAILQNLERKATMPVDLISALKAYKFIKHRMVPEQERRYEIK